MSELPEITEIQRLRLNPGDTLVITFPGHLTPAVAEMIRERLRQKFPESVTILILDQGARLAVLESP